MLFSQEFLLYSHYMTNNTRTSRPIRHRIAAGLIGAGVLAGSALGVTLGTGSASAGVTVKIHDRPAGNAKVVGWINADCRTIGHSPRVYSGGGYWYKIGKDRWIFNSPKSPFCH